MQCPHCRTWNDAEDHRCQRCGRRVATASARPALETYPITTATAPALNRLVAPDLRVEPRPAVAYQPPLFREMPQVIPVPTLQPVRSSAPRKRASRPAVPDGQQRLDFEAPKTATHVEAVIYCDAAVAEPTHRVIACALDVAMIVVGFGLFLAAFIASGGDVVLNRSTVPFYVVAVLATAALYHALWGLAGGDTPGLRWMRLELVNFDGHPASRELRLRRLAAGWVSLLAAGLGLLWALVDEESLTWHDHISKTFPTPQS